MASVLVESPYADISLDIPAVDICTYIFSSGTQVFRDAPAYFQAGQPEVNYSLNQAQGYVKRFAKGLQRRGINKDDKVLLSTGNNLYFPVVLWGVLAAGGVFTGISPTASLFEFVHQLRDSQAKFVVVGPDQLEKATEAVTQCGLSPDCLLVLSDTLVHQSAQKCGSHCIPEWTSIWASEEEIRHWHWKKITSLDEARSTTAIINYSSGTTGLPKGVEISHYNLVSQAEQILFKRLRVGKTREAQLRYERLQESGERWLAPLPMYHAFGQTYYCMVAPRSYAKVYIMPKFDMTRFLTYIDIYRITFVNVVPAMLKSMTKVPNAGRFNLRALQIVGSGSAPLDVDVARKVEAMFLRPGLQIKQGWGMTETTCNVTGFAPDDPDDGRSIGWVNPLCRVRIVEVPGQQFDKVEGSLVGEIWVSGPNMMKGYWKNEKATAETVVNGPDGWLYVKTGDIGYADRRGCLYIVGRIKELIKVKGLQVSPAELESALMTHPGVLEAAVVGVNIDGNEMPRAFVVRRDSSATAETLDKLIRSQFGRYKWLTGGIYFLGSLPRTGIGKVMKRALPNPTADRRSKL